MASAAALVPISAASARKRVGQRQVGGEGRFGWKRGLARRNSEAATCSASGGRSVSSRARPARRRRARRRARAGLHQPELGQPRVASEYSDCTAATGCTTAARLSDEGAISEKPMARVLPARTSPPASRPPPRSAPRVAPVHVEEVHRLEPEPGSGCRRARPPDAPGSCRSSAARSPGRGGSPALVAMRNAARAPAAACEEAADHALRQPHAVDVRGVDMVDAELERRRQHRMRLCLGRSARRPRRTTSPRPRSPRPPPGPSRRACIVSPSAAPRPRRSVGIDGAVPGRVTEMPATAQPKRTASAGSRPRASPWRSRR